MSVEKIKEFAERPGREFFEVICQNYPANAQLIQACPLAWNWGTTKLSDYDLNGLASNQNIAG